MRIAVYAALVATSSMCAAQQYTIDTFAGGGPLAAPASEWNLSLTTDAEGNQYVASQHTVFRRDRSGGAWTRIAGNSRPGYSGDGGAAVKAQLDNPWSVAVDAAGNVFIADTGNHRVRKVSVDGVITTVAGSGQAPQAPSADGRLALAVAINPLSVAVAPDGTLFFADCQYGTLSTVSAPFNRVRRILPDGTIATVAGGGDHPGAAGAARELQLSAPLQIALDRNGDLFIADTTNAAVRVVTRDGMMRTMAAGTDPGLFAFGQRCVAGGTDLCMPFAVAPDRAGNVYVAELGYRCCYDFNDYILGNFAVRQISADGTLATVAGSATPGIPCDCADVARGSVSVDDAGDLFFADSFIGRRIAPDGSVVTLIDGMSSRFTGDGGPAKAAQLYYPEGVATDDQGDVFIADAGNNRVRKVSRDGVITTIAGNGSAAFAGDGGLALEAALWGVVGVAVDHSGNLFLADRGNHRVRRVSADGVITTVAASGADTADGVPAVTPLSDGPIAVAVDGEGNVYFAERTRVRKVTPQGAITTVAGGGTGTLVDGEDATRGLLLPASITVDRDGTLLVGEAFGSVRRISKSGIVTTIAGRGSNTAPNGISAESLAVTSDGNVLIGGSAKVMKLAPGGALEVIAGTGDWGYAGDGGPATAAAIIGVYALAADQAGNIYVATGYGDAVRVLRPYAPRHAAPPGR